MTISAVHQGSAFRFSDAEVTQKKTADRQVFLGHVLATLLEPLVPKEGAYADPNSQLFMSMWFEQLAEQPSFIQDMGFGDEIEHTV